MMKDNEIDWCKTCNAYICWNVTLCNRCQSFSGSKKPPTNYMPIKNSDYLKKGGKSMVVTIIGSMTTKKEMDKIKAFWKRRGAVVNSPEVQKEPLVDIQRTWIEKIEEADLIIAIPKGVAMTANGDSKYVLEFGESTSYEMAIAKRFNRPVLFFSDKEG